MNVLITAGTTAAAFALHQKLGDAKPVIFGDNENFPVPGFLQSRFITIPAPEKETFLHDFLTVCLDKSVDTVYALRDEERRLLATAEQLFAEYGIEISNILPIL